MRCQYHAKHCSCLNWAIAWIERLLNILCNWDLCLNAWGITGRRRQKCAVSVFKKGFVLHYAHEWTLGCKSILSVHITCQESFISVKYYHKISTIASQCSSLSLTCIYLLMPTSLPLFPVNLSSLCHQNNAPIRHFSIKCSLFSWMPL